MQHSPLTPYLDQELLYNNPLSVDGSAIEKTGFTYDYPQLTEADLRAQVKYFVDLGVFPPAVLK